MTLQWFSHWYGDAPKERIVIVVEIDNFAVTRLGSLHHHDPQSEAPATDHTSLVDNCRFPSRIRPSYPLLSTSGSILFL